MDVSWCILILIIVCLVVAGTVGAVISTKENRDSELSCKTDLECKPIKARFNTTKEKILLPTHCLNILNKDEHRCAWLWPEGLYELVDLEEYIDPTDPSVDTTTNLRDWMKSRTYDVYTTLDLNKLPQHHQTIEIVDEDMCPFPFMDFIPLGSRDVEKRIKDLKSLTNKHPGVIGQLTQEIAEDIHRASLPQSEYKQSISKEEHETGDQQFGVCAVFPSNTSRVLAHLETPSKMVVEGALTRFQRKN